MVDLLKAFGRGILYVLAFPFFLVVLAIFAVVGFIAFIIQLVKSIIFFFTGQKFFPELPEDKELRLLKEKEEVKNKPANNEATPAAQTQQESNNLIFEEVFDEPAFEEEPAPVITPIPTPAPKSVEEACFQDLNKKEETKEEVPPAAPIFEEVKEEEEPVIEELNVKQEEVKEEPVSPLTDLIEEEQHEEDPLDDFLSALEEDEIPSPQEELETYKPRGSEDSFQDEDNDDNHMGVDINYDD